jgi:hypothetical protein
MSEAFVNTIKGDYIAGANRSTTAAIIEQISSWIEDYTAVAPFSALGFRSRLEYCGEQQSEQNLAQKS